MLRSRLLKSDSSSFILHSFFSPSPDSDDLSEEKSAMVIKFSFDFDKETCLQVLSFSPLPLPSLAVIQEEVSYMFNLLKSLQDHETSSPSFTPDFQEI